MSINLDYNSLKVEECGRTVYVPKNDLARLMYYLDCALAVIQYEEDNKLTDYEHYYNLSEEEEKAVYKLAVFFNPKIFIDGKVFIFNPDLVPYNSNNQFYKITDDRIGVHVNQEIIIGGRVVRVLKVMALTKEWLNKNYFEPLERLNYKYNSQKTKGYLSSSNTSENTCCSNCSWKKCLFCFLFICLIIGIGNMIKNSSD